MSSEQQSALKLKKKLLEAKKEAKKPEPDWLVPPLDKGRLGKYIFKHDNGLTDGYYLLNGRKYRVIDETW